ncbi:uncharacterized protein LOC111024527 [Momordica charantia]|uniref:Uncharacterized protein LOC111024527 n=1 Tax=Momordica charantia TaxID=3673 RepID=A0A6J1DVS9_MOMCH|nr:uncharacterized protein LOC111024527 [Momordica charantia]
MTQQRSAGALAVYYLGNPQNSRNNPYSNTYNPGWRNHPNFSWSGKQEGHNVGTSNAPAFQQKVSYCPGFANQGQRVAQKQSEGSFASLEKLMKQYMANNDVIVQSQAASLRNLELQVGQLATDLKSRPQLHVNILVEVLEQMPNYMRFLKEILTKKRTLGEYETVAMTKACSTILISKIPAKMKDPGSFTIPVSIGGQQIGLALCDLGASINLMSLSIYNKLVIAEEDKKVSIILGRPFLPTERVLVDVHKGELTMRVQDQEVKFSVHDSMKFPTESE